MKDFINMTCVNANMKSGRLARLILIALVCLLLAAGPVSAQTTRSANSYATLVSAINSANSSSGDTINISGTITLTADLPAITKSVTINGVGNNATINGADSHRAFVINTAGIAVVINNLTLANNQAPLNSHGGAINFPGGDGTADLTLNNVTIRDSDAWYSGSNGRGGALYCNSSTLTIRNSRFYNNRGEEGGGILLGGFCFGATITRSAIFNNEAKLNGGGLHISRGAGVIINNTSIFGNKVGDATGAADGRGAAIYIVGTGSGAPQRPIHLNHVTITGNRNAEPNQSANDQDEGALHFVLAGVQLHVRNSIIYGNSSERQCSRNLSNVPQLSTNVGNIIGSGNCGTPTGVFGGGGDPQLPAKPPASAPWYALSPGSPAVDGAACISGINQDQRGRGRRSGVRCDIGAYEYQYPPPPPSDDTGGSGGGGSDDDDSDSQQAAKPAVSTCLTLEGIAAYNISESTQCQRVNAMQIANPNIKEGDFVDAVDVWSWVMPNTRICFEAAGGSFTFIDTAAMPRTMSDLAACSLNGMACAAIDGPGILVLLPGDATEACAGFAPAAPPIPAAPKPVTRSLSGCMVTLTEVLKFRESPGGGLIIREWIPDSLLPKDAKLTAVERTDSWFKVDWYGVKGWISADYVETEGTCG